MRVGKVSAFPTLFGPSTRVLLRRGAGTGCCAWCAPTRCRTRATRRTSSTAQASPSPRDQTAAAATAATAMAAAAATGRWTAHPPQALGSRRGRRPSSLYSPRQTTAVRSSQEKGGVAWVGGWVGGLVGRTLSCPRRRCVHVSMCCCSRACVAHHITLSALSHTPPRRAVRQQGGVAPARPRGATARRRALRRERRQRPWWCPWRRRRRRSLYARAQ